MTAPDARREKTGPSATPTGASSTGFRPLDDLLDGGLSPGRVVLVRGPHAVGKSVAALQWARNVARQERAAIFVAHPREESKILLRLFLLEYGEMLAESGEPPTRDGRNGKDPSVRLAEVLWTDPIAHGRLAERISSYSDRLVRLRARSDASGMPDLYRLVEDHGGADEVVVFLDYLAKPGMYPSYDEPWRLDQVSRDIDELSHRTGVPVVLTADVTWSASRSLNPLRTPTMPLLGVSDVLISLRPGDGDRVRFNVAWPHRDDAPVDVEFDADFVHYRFDPIGKLRLLG